VKWFFFAKKTKKLLLLWSVGAGGGSAHAPGSKFFCVAPGVPGFFKKKETLAFGDVSH
jgi:hypothetical protein